MNEKEQGQEREPVTRDSPFVKEHYGLWSWFGKMQGYLKVSRGFDEEFDEDALLKDLTIVRRKIQRARLLAFCHDFLTTCCEAPEDMLLKEFLQGFKFITDDELEDLNTILHVPKAVEKDKFRFNMKGTVTGRFDSRKPNETATGKGKGESHVPTPD